MTGDRPSGRSNVSRRRLQRLGRAGAVAGQTVRCVYCLRSVQEATEDHVIAQSWYPESTPENVEKWKVPSCRPCNTRYSKLEDDLKIRLAFCVDPSNPAAQGVYERARRALDPHMGKNPTDRRLSPDSPDALKVWVTGSPHFANPISGLGPGTGRDRGVSDG